MNFSPPGMEPHQPSLSEVHGSVEIPRQLSFWRRLFAFSGPAYLVSVGYMDPGNWATDIAAGSKFGYGLLWVLVMSNLMAVLLQSSRRGWASSPAWTWPRPAAPCSPPGHRGSSGSWPRWRSRPATWPRCWARSSACSCSSACRCCSAVLITALDTFVLLLLHHRGVRQMEAFILALVLTIGICFGDRDLPGPARTGDRWRPASRRRLPGEGALFVAIGILGATVMPHNLYLHSALVQSRRIAHTPAGIRQAIRFNTIDSVIALNGALLVNAALLVLAAATFFKAAMFDVAEIQDAHRLLEPLLGAKIAPDRLRRGADRRRPVARPSPARSPGRW